MFDDHSIELTAQMRQAGSENVNFRDQLDRLASGKFTKQDWQSWSARDMNKMSEDCQKVFRDQGTMLCAMKKDMKEFNRFHLLKTGWPVAKVTAENSPGTQQFESDIAGGLHNFLYLSRGAKVVITANLWAEAKLGNSSKGVVEYIIYKAGTSPRNSLPAIVICNFPAYTGPSYIPGVPGLVPIVPTMKTWFAKNKQFSRQAYSLILSWALTIDKSQSG